MRVVCPHEGEQGRYKAQSGHPTAVRLCSFQLCSLFLNQRCTAAVSRPPWERRISIHNSHATSAPPLQRSASDLCLCPCTWEGARRNPQTLCRTLWKMEEDEVQTLKCEFTARPETQQDTADIRYFSFSFLHPLSPK